MAETVTLTNLANLQNETTAVGAINANNAAITTAFADVLSRTGSAPNTMQNILDMNSNRIVNVPTTPTGANDAASKAYVDANSNAAAVAAATNAQTSANNAATSASQAQTSATAAAASAGASQANSIASVYSFDTSTSTGTSPAIGGIRFNNAALGSVTTVAINNQTNETGNPDIHTWIDHWADSTNTVKGYLEIKKIGATTNFAIFTVTATTSQSGFRQITVSTQSSGGTLGNGDQLAVVFTRTGDAGAAGSGVTQGGPNLIALYTASATIAAGITGASAGTALLQSSGAVPTWSNSPSWTNLALTGSAAVTGTVSGSTYNGLAISPSSGATLTIVGGKTLSCANTITFSGNDAITVALSSGGTFTTTKSTAVIFDNIPQNSQSAGYTTVLSDASKHIIHPNSDNASRTFTIDSNANVAYPIGTTIMFINAGGGTNTNTLTIAITSDTLRFSGTSNGTGSRSLAVGGVATALKTGTTEWHIFGTGLT